MRQKSRRLLMILASLALASFVALLSLQGAAEIPYWGVHTVMALGMLPLIFAVMAYFVPVLTRTGAEDKAVMLLPLLALAGGVLALAGLAGMYAGLQTGALLAAASALALLGWMHRRRVLSLGAPHPGLAWYQAALLFLVLGLLAILAGSVWPEHWPWLRRLHLHFNLLGFVGLTAIGTLQVLLPTAGGYLDADAAQRLRVGLKYGVAGTLLIGAGAAWLPLLAWLGLLAWMLPLTALGMATLRQRGQMRRGAVSALSSALLGYVLVLLSGLLHSLGLLAPRQSVMLFFLLFLLPLVTGAVSYLLPLWWQPGAEQAWTTRVRAWLERGSLTRALIFPACGLMLLAGVGWAVYPAVAMLVVFIGQILWVLLRAPQSRG
jgi:hypothetical protein